MLNDEANEPIQDNCPDTTILIVLEPMVVDFHYVTVVYEELEMLVAHITS